MVCLASGCTVVGVGVTDYVSLIYVYPFLLFKAVVRLPTLKVYDGPSLLGILISLTLVRIWVGVLIIACTSTI